MSADLNHLLAGLGTGLAGGVLSGLFGVGGGVVMVPLLGLVLHLDQHRAQGATLAAMLLPTGLPAVLQYRSRGIHTSLRLVGVLVLAFLFGIYGGARVANLIPSGPLRWGYAAFLVLLALVSFAGLRKAGQTQARFIARTAPDSSCFRGQEGPNAQFSIVNS